MTDACRHRSDHRLEQNSATATSRTKGPASERSIDIHPNFGRHLKAKMDELGIENVFVNMSDPKADRPTTDMYDFFKKHFKM